MTRLIATLALSSWLVLECLAQEPSRPQKDPVITVEATAVVVDVIVTDRKGRHVQGLTTNDFKLSEDNSPQTIQSFTSPAVGPGPQHLDRRTAGRAEEASSTVDAQHPATAQQAQTPQLITVLIDLGDLHSDSLKRACAATAKFAANTIEAGNFIAIYWVDTSLHLGVPFTRDRKKALEMVENLSSLLPSGRFTVAERERTLDELDAMHSDSAAIPTNPGAGSPPPDPMSHARDMLRSWITTANALQARTVFVALRAMALAYRDLPGRKTVVVFSEGFLHALDGRPEIDAVIDAANRSNVAFYVIDASGITQGGLDGKDPMSVRRRTYDNPLGPDIGEGRGGRVAGGLGEFDFGQTLGSDRRGDLGSIAKATGGLLIKDTNDLEPALDRVEDDASEFYTLVYSPSNVNYDGAFRKIKVELAQHGYHLRYRQGYWALPPQRAALMTPTAARLLADLESGERKASFTPELSAVLVPATDGRFAVSAAVSMPGRLVRFNKVKDDHLAGVAVVLVARDIDGKLLAVHERYGDMRFKSKQREEFSARLFNLQGSVLIPGLQAISVQAVVQFVDGTLGVSERQTVNPARGASSLSLTSLVLSDRQTNTPCSPSPTDPLCIQGARILLPAQPIFARTTTLTVYSSVLGAGLDAAQKPRMGIAFNLRSGDTLKLFKPRQLMVSPGNAPHMYLVMSAFELESLQPGKYTLEMTVEDKLRSDRATELKEFTIQ